MCVIFTLDCTMRYKYNQRLIQSDCVFDFDVASFLLFFSLASLFFKYSWLGSL